MKKLLPLLILTLVFSTTLCFSQDQEVIMTKKNISDTALVTTRTLLIPEPFDAQKVMLQLFPGKYYKLVEYKGNVINWSCKTCKPITYPDVNEDAVSAFPFKEGVSTRLINIMDYQDSSGVRYKVMSFNHSVFDEEGNMTSRFTGGILGLAKFTSTPQGWKLRSYQPAIAAYGAFSQSPAPKLVMIGKDQYAFMLKHSNGGGGGPFDGAFFLIAGTGSSYQQVMAAYGIERTAVSEEEALCDWTSTYSVPVSNKKYFRDILITTNGNYTASDKNNLPEDVLKLVKNRKKGKFTMQQRYVYKAGKGYLLQGPAKATVD